MTDVVTQAIADALKRPPWLPNDSVARREALAAHVAAAVRAVVFPVIETVEDLEALPRETVIRDARGVVSERWGLPGSWEWLSIGDSERDWGVKLPMTVLWRPEGGA